MKRSEARRHWLYCLRCRRLVAERAVRSDSVIFMPPPFHHDFRLIQRIEELPVQQLIPHLCSDTSICLQASGTVCPWESRTSASLILPIICSAVWRFLDMKNPPNRAVMPKGYRKSSHSTWTDVRGARHRLRFGPELYLTYRLNIAESAFPVK